MPHQLALVGIGKIAVDQHVPALAASSDFALAATASRAGKVADVVAYADFDLMLAEHPEISVISLCLPPQPRFDYAARALRAGRHVMLEKPPGQSLAEVHSLQNLAAQAGVTLYATWHSRAAMAVAAAKAWLVDKQILRGHITWREDVRHWHPGQDWVFEPGGMGVFDPGINALSILTEILPEPIHVTAARLEFPANRDTPIAAQITFSNAMTADFDWRQTGPQTWDIEIETDAGQMALRMGGNRLEINGAAVTGGNSLMGEYPALYARMAWLIATGQSDVDLSPLVHVADAMMLGRRISVADFEF